MHGLFFVVISLVLWAAIVAECPNACSGHGTCGPYDMCTCYKGYIEGDCSLRTCPIGRAHFDTPKGDLDGSTTLSGPDEAVIPHSVLYPAGTSETYPRMVDSDQNTLANTAHEYVECSGKGHCDRKLGLCVCMPGYAGASCQYNNCPYSISEGGFCWGHGVCESVRSIAARDYGNIYELWDADVSLGCVCDPGYYGYNCKYRRCKVDYDPLYMDNVDASRRYSNWTYAIFTRNENATITGNYSLVFSDVYDKQWELPPVDIGATCGDLIRAFESLPNRAIPQGSVRCVRWTDYSTIPQSDEPIALPNTRYYGIKYSLAFPRNPGVLKPLDINIRAERGSKRITLQSDEPHLVPVATSTLGWFVYANGFTGETTDNFHDRCIQVDVTLATYTSGTTKFQYLSGLTLMETKLLMRCLGDADGFVNRHNATAKVSGQTFGWDYGTRITPHIIKLVEKSSKPPLTDMCGIDNEDGLRAGLSLGISDDDIWPRTKLCRYGFPSTQNSAEQPETKPMAEQDGVAAVHPSLYHKGDDRYYGPDTSKRAPGFLTALIYDPTLKLFKILTRPGEDYSATTEFAVFTTTGVARMVSNNAKVFSSERYVYRDPGAGVLHSDGPYSNTLYSTNTTSTHSGFFGDVSCETAASGRGGVIDCINKGNRVIVLDPSQTTTSYALNPKYLNLHTVTKIHRVHHSLMNSEAAALKEQYAIHLEAGMNAHYRNIAAHTGRIYNFYPPTDGTGYTYVSECSNRGHCNVDTGECTCYSGYKYDACAYQVNPET